MKHKVCEIIEEKFGGSNAICKEREGKRKRKKGKEK